MACWTQYVICAGTGLAPPTSAPGLGSPRPHPRRDRLTSAQGRALRSYIQPFVVRAIDSGLRLSPELRTYVDHVSPSARPPARPSQGPRGPPAATSSAPWPGRLAGSAGGLRGSIDRSRRSPQVHDLLLRAPRRPHGGGQRVPQSPPRRRRGTHRPPSSVAESLFSSRSFRSISLRAAAAVGSRDRWLHAAVTS